MNTPERSSQLPKGWQRLGSRRLEDLLDTDTFPYLDDEDADDVNEELDKRHDADETEAGHHHDQLADRHNESPFP